MSEIITGRQVVATNTYTSPIVKEEAEFVWMHAIYTSDATVGNRRLRIEMLDESGNEWWDARAGAVQAASNIYDYALMWGVYRETSFIDGQIHVPFPHRFVLPANMSYKIYDANNISASDSFIFTFQYRVGF